MVSIGPFPITVFAVVLAVLVAIGAGALAARRLAPGKTGRLSSLVMDMTLIGLVVARAGFVLWWWPDYRAEPWSIVQIGDGGFLIWAGVLAAALFAFWRVRRVRALWQPLAVAMAAGWLVWVVAGGLLSLQQAQIQLPDATLSRLNGGDVALSQMTGKPMVVNLWATWCPPCRREMPMLEAAQQQYGDIRFVFVNQREGRHAVLDYLHNQNLTLDHVLIDARGDIAQVAGSQALPTTLFYDASGRLVTTHVGMLTRASLAAQLQRFK